MEQGHSENESLNIAIERFGDENFFRNELEDLKIKGNNPDKHIKILATLYIAFGCFSIPGAISIIAMSSTAISPETTLLQPMK